MGQMIGARGLNAKIPSTLEQSELYAGRLVSGEGASKFKMDYIDTTGAHATWLPFVTTSFSNQVNGLTRSMSGGPGRSGFEIDKSGILIWLT